jgi:deoxyadenosine/deoxycytidine kinase
MMAKNYRQALADARKCHELGGTDGSVPVKIAQCCVVLGLVGEGRTALQQLQANHPQAKALAEKLDHIETNFNQSVVFADQKKFKEAENAIDRYRCPTKVQFICN